MSLPVRANHVVCAVALCVAISSSAQATSILLTDIGVTEQGLYGGRSITSAAARSFSANPPDVLPAFLPVPAQVAAAAVVFQDQAADHAFLHIDCPPGE